MADKSFKKIDESDLEKVNGGYIFDTNQICECANPDIRFEVIDSKGNVIDRLRSEVDAKMLARYHGEKFTSLSWEQLQRLRETGSPD
jgi:hypothetical protein